MCLDESIFASILNLNVHKLELKVLSKNFVLLKSHLTEVTWIRSKMARAGADSFFAFAFNDARIAAIWESWEALCFRKAAWNPRKMNLWIFSVHSSQ